MIIYVIVVTYLMMVVMNKLTSNVMDDWNLDEIHVIYWNKIWYILHPNYWR